MKRGNIRKLLSVLAGISMATTCIAVSTGTATAQDGDPVTATQAIESTGSDTQDGDGVAAPAGGSDAVTATYDGHTVQGLSPSNTTINLFDYWLTEQNDKDNAGINRATLDGGINKGHALKFSKLIKGLIPRSQGGWCSSKCPYNASSGAAKDFNVASGSNAPRSGMVAAMLNEAGYPQLQRNDAIGITEDKLKGDTDGGSLEYLFNPKVVSTGKKSYAGVSNLLRLNENGYYYYDSQRNFAEFDEDANSFNLYDKPAVNPENKDSATGQFFPLNSADDVFSTSGDGSIHAKGINSENEVLNHYFGMTMTTDFVQPAGGMVDGDTPMTYEFSGDDDVWVYIDDVLVGDIGGSHAVTKLKIDFRTGAVYVNGAKQDKSIGDLLAAQGKTGVNGDTLTDGSYHTLKFFYLERGNYDSNMSLRFNLAQIQTSDLVKVDQYGQALAGASFNLYTVDENHRKIDGEGNVGDSALPLASGETDANGWLALVYARDDSLKDAAGNLIGRKGEIVDFHRRYDAGKANGVYYVLEEESAPAGYQRMLGSMNLQYEPAGDGTSGSLVSYPKLDDPYSSVWTTGAHARGKEILTAPASFTTTGGECSGADGCAVSDTVGDGKGTLFAVILRKNAKGQWETITGDLLKGWTAGGVVADGSQNDVSHVIEAYKKDGYTFQLSDGVYQANIDGMPGYLDEYYHWMNDADAAADAAYTVGVYYSSETDAGRMNISNTWRVASLDSFACTFSSRFYIPNIANELYVQKVDDKGNPLAGATFGLYTESQLKKSDGKVEVHDDGSVTPTLNADGTQPAEGEAATPFDSVSTGDQWCGSDTGQACSDGDPSTPDFAGAAAFGLASNGAMQAGFSGKALVNGTYYLVETQAPAGYARNPRAVKVIVNDSGVFVNAGQADDGVKVVRGTGKLVATMSTFGATGSFDDTLRYVKAYPYVLKENGVMSGAVTHTSALYPATANHGRIEASDESQQDALRLEYRDGYALDYGPLTDGGNYLFVGDEGWPVIRAYQDSRPAGVEAEERTTLVNADGTDPTKAEGALSSLVTSFAMVQVTNKKAMTSATISMNKKVEGSDWNPNDHGGRNFTFTLTRVNVNDDGTVTGENDGSDCAVITTERGASDCGGSDAAKVGSVSAATNGSIQQDTSQEIAFRLSFTAAGNYHFRLSENTDDRISGWSYDTTKLNGSDGALVTVIVKADPNTGALSSSVVYGYRSSRDRASGSTPPTFVNTYVAVSSLPMTGGDATGRTFLWLGLLLAGITALTAAGTSKWKHRMTNTAFR